MNDSIQQERISSGYAVKSYPGNKVQIIGLKGNILVSDLCVIASLSVTFPKKQKQDVCV